MRTDEIATKTRTKTVLTLKRQKQKKIDVTVNIARQLAIVMMNGFCFAFEPPRTQWHLAD